MRKSVDFSKGRQGKHAGMKLEVHGASESRWAVCIEKSETKLIPFKLYNIETFSRTSKVRLKNEDGETAYYPKEWFAVLDVSKKTQSLLERAA